ncbi:hypothetical protein [Indioceanicola profundi]|uniref:hypothetical protein n=1 Tax=Indioceanicola profundi TaxID=2220096 RepID=UPI000E6A9EFC|nr:hypothetical protein [Indioceanicola profundi]
MVGGKASPLASLRGQGTAITVTALLLGGSLLGGSAFHLLSSGSARPGIAGSPAEVMAKAVALDEVHASLGHGGLLQNLSLYAETSAATAREAMTADLDAAAKSLDGYKRQPLSQTEAALARDLDRMLDTYRRILAERMDPGLLAGPAGLTLLAQHAALTDRITRLNHEQALAGQDNLARAAERGLWLSLAAALSLAAGLGAMLWLLRVQILSPMRSLSASVADAARADWRTPVYGVGRQDELGELARIVDEFRAQAAAIPDISLAGEEGRLRFRFEGKQADLFSALTARLQEAGDALTQRGTELAGMTAAVRRDLTGTVAEVKDLCAETVRASGESNARIVKSSDLLAHAAAQVQAFDARGRSGGLDGLVATLTSHTQEVAELLADAGHRISHTLRAISGTEGEMREATSTARDAAKGLADAMADTQERLFGAVKLLKSSGDLLSTTASDAGERLARVADSVDAGEKALVAALGQATTTLDEVTRAASDRLEDAAAHMSRSADLLENQAIGVGGQLHGALDELREAGGLLRQTTETQTNRLDPLAGQLERLESGLSTIVADVGLRAGEIGRTLEDFQLLGASFQAELDRLRIEPETRAAAESMLMRMTETADLLSNQVEIVEDSAKRLAQSLAGGVDEATASLRDATRELHAESRSLAADAATATAALTRAAARQDEMLETMAGHASLASDLRAGLEQAGDLSGALGAATDAVQALASTADHSGREELAEMAALIRGLQERVDGLDRLADGLTAAAETVRALMEAHDLERAGDTQEHQALIALAADLKDRLANVGRLEAELTEATRAVRGLGERETESHQALSGLTRALDSRLAGIDGLSGQLTLAINALMAAADRNNANTAASANASKELGLKLAQVAEQLRATATGLAAG